MKHITRFGTLAVLSLGLIVLPGVTPMPAEARANNSLRWTGNVDSIVDVYFRDALRIRLHIQHVARVMRLGLRVAVILAGRIEMSAGAGRIGGAAIALLMKMKSKLTVRRQSLNHS